MFRKRCETRLFGIHRTGAGASPAGWSQRGITGMNSRRTKPQPELLLHLDHRKEQGAGGDDEKAVERGDGPCAEDALESG